MVDKSQSTSPTQLYIKLFGIQTLKHSTNKWLCNSVFNHINTTKIISFL